MGFPVLNAVLERPALGRYSGPLPSPLGPTPLVGVPWGNWPTAPWDRWPSDEKVPLSAHLEGSCPHCGQVSHLGSRMGQKRPPPPGVCCQKDPAGNTVCSDGQIFPEH